jgi:hypothetical protein
MVGTCDVCQAENVELARGWVTGIETFYCAEGCQDDEQLRRETEENHENRHL